jgi:hypothetical protein
LCLDDLKVGLPSAVLSGRRPYRTRTNNFLYMPTILPCRSRISRQSTFSLFSMQSDRCRIVPPTVSHFLRPACQKGWKTATNQTVCVCGKPKNYGVYIIYTITPFHRHTIEYPHLLRHVFVCPVATLFLLVVNRFGGLIECVGVCRCVVGGQNETGTVETTISKSCRDDRTDTL